MEQKKTRKILLVLIVVSIIISILGTVLLFNATNFSEQRELNQQDSSTGVISLNIGSNPQEYTSGGLISLDIVEK